MLCQLWKEDGISQQDLCNRTFRDKPSITRLVDNLEKLQLVKRVSSDSDRRINLVYLTRQGIKLEEISMQLAGETLNEALNGISTDHVNLCKDILHQVYENMK